MTVSIPRQVEERLQELKAENEELKAENTRLEKKVDQPRDLAGRYERDRQAARRYITGRGRAGADTTGSE